VARGIVRNEKIHQEIDSRSLEGALSWRWWPRSPPAEAVYHVFLWTGKSTLVAIAKRAQEPSIAS